MKILIAILVLFFMTYSKVVFSDPWWTMSEHGINFYLNHGYEIYDMKYLGDKIYYQLINSDDLVSDKLVICYIGMNATNWPDTTTCWYEVS